MSTILDVMFVGYGIAAGLTGVAVAYVDGHLPRFLEGRFTRGESR